MVWQRREEANEATAAVAVVAAATAVVVLLLLLLVLLLLLLPQSSREGTDKYQTLQKSTAIALGAPPEMLQNRCVPVETKKNV